MNIESEKAIYVQADLTDPAQAQNVVDKAVEAFGQVDKLVCCAGVTFIGSLETTSYDSFLREISINLGGVFNMCKAAVKELVKSQDPSIVTIGSDLGVRPIPERIGYCPSKAGVIMLTKCIALEYAPQGAGQLRAARPGAHPHDRATLPGGRGPRRTGGGVRLPVPPAQNGQGDGHGQRRPVPVLQ